MNEENENEEMISLPAPFYEQNKVYVLVDRVDT
jgi:hypothetical protein